LYWSLSERCFGAIFAIIADLLATHPALAIDFSSYFKPS